jgi:hypothetical protein
MDVDTGAVEEEARVGDRTAGRRAGGAAAAAAAAAVAGGGTVASRLRESPG